MELYRYQSEILMKLFDKHETVRADILCQEVKMSVNSLRKTIDQINDVCTNQGMQIVSKVGSGYMIEITDPTKYEAFSRSVKAMYYRNQFFRDSSSDMVHYIIRRILAGNRISLDDIANELYVSLSTVNRYMQTVKKYFKEYELELKNHTNSGLTVEGSEWKHRLALVNEYQIYHTFKLQDEYVPEEAFEQFFLSGGTYRKIIINSIRTILSKEKYILPFDNAREFVDLLILTITRKNHSDQLEHDKYLCAGKEYTKEAEIITKIFHEIPNSYTFSLSETELLLLCSFLKASKVVYKEDLELSSFAESSKTLVEEFIKHEKNNYETSFNISSDKVNDLVCNTVMLMNRIEVGIHKNVREVRSIRSDGLLNMELCMDLYEFLHSKNIDCTAEDALGFYYIFSGLMNTSNHTDLRKILLISRYGYYYAKNVARIINQISQKENIIFYPVEYLGLADINLNDVSGIATDIDEIRQEYNPKLPVYMVHYMRTNQSAFSLIQRITCSREKFSNDYFKKDDLIYTDNIKNMKDLYKYISSLFSSISEKQKERYIFSLQEQDNNFSPVRKRTMLFIHDRHKIVSEYMFKIIVPTNNMNVFKNEKISYIVVVNIPNNNVETIRFLYSKIAELLHAEDVVFTGNQSDDYEMLLKIMYRHDHIVVDSIESASK